LDTPDFTDHIDFLRKETDKALKRLPLPQNPSTLYDPITYALKGEGKRLRPILTHLVGRAFQADPEDLMNAGIAVELLHNFTLVHDDIMDADDTRHGQDSVHIKWNESTAILAGDGIIVLAQLALNRVHHQTFQAIKCFNKAALTVCEGQAMDLDFASGTKIGIMDYLNMIEKKTGSLLGCSAELGGILANQNENICSHLHTFGCELGKAFQIQDDILEIFSNPESMGKSLGSDVLTDKQTVLSLLAKKDNSAEWDKISKEAKELNIHDRLTFLRTYYEKSGIRLKASLLAETAIEEARRCLKVIPEMHKAELEQFALMILNREK
jgi:geranylgeranyl pyrophosphate synthase